jgi:hypothetical protein
MLSARLLLVPALLTVPAIASGAVQTIKIQNHMFERHLAGPVQALHLVRDAAAPSDGLPAAVDRWYVGRNEENPEHAVEALSRTPATQGLKVAEDGRAATALAIQPLVNPATGALDIMCSLPGTESARVEVFDVMGRRVTARDIDVVSAGMVRVRLNSGVRLAAGSYWIKLIQGSRAPISQRVVLR